MWSFYKVLGGFIELNTEKNGDNLHSHSSPLQTCSGNIEFHQFLDKICYSFNCMGTENEIHLKPFCQRTSELFMLILFFCHLYCIFSCICLHYIVYNTWHSGSEEPRLIFFFHEIKHLITLPWKFWQNCSVLKESFILSSQHTPMFF